MKTPVKDVDSARTKLLRTASGPKQEPMVNLPKRTAKLIKVSAKGTPFPRPAGRSAKAEKVRAVE